MAVKVRVSAFLFLCAAVFFLTGESMSGPHINDLNLLLPPRIYNPVRYRLQGTDGCFSWTWDHHDILSVLPEYNETSQCSASAQIISLAPYSGRRATAVHAFDIHSGQVIRCEVFVDKISRIQIFHHSVKLDLDGLATLRIHAFDAEDNVFSSLVGLRFIWQLSPIRSEGSVTPHKLAHVPLTNTPLSDCGGFCGDIVTRIDLEEAGHGSDLFVVQGTDIGQESVSVRLAEPGLEHLSDKIVLTVAEAMSLEPHSPVLVIMGTQLSYTLKILRRNKHEVVSLPSPNHRWFVSNSSVASVDSSMGIVDAIQIGSTNIIVEDLRVTGHQQLSAFHVVVPNELVLYLSSYGKPKGMHDEELVSSTTPWYFVVGREYVVHLKAFSWHSSSRPIYLTKSNSLALRFDGDPHWDAFSIPEDIAANHGWQNCSRLLAKSEGQGKLIASLRYFSTDYQITEAKTLQVPDMVISVAQEVKVCAPVKIYFSQTNEFNQLLTLPWYPGIYQKVEMTAKGGCAKSVKEYEWYSSDTSILAVLTSGVFQAKRPGRAIVRVVAVSDRSNYDEVAVEVSIPSALTMLEGLPVEVPVGTNLPAAVILKNSSGYSFSKCDAFNSLIKWQILGAAQTFNILNQTNWNSFLSMIDFAENQRIKDLSIPVCAWTALYASHAGRASVNAYLSSISKEHYTDIVSPGSLKVSWSVAAYVPLTIHQVGDGNSYGGYKHDLDIADWNSVDKKWDLALGLTELILAPGSEMKIYLRGGPERWRQGVEFVESSSAVTADDQRVVRDIALINQLGDNGGRLYSIVCLSLGNFTLTFKRGNLIGEDHPTPAISRVDLSLICSFPSSIYIIADESANTFPVIKAASQAEYSDSHIRSTPVIVTNGRVIRISAVGLHQTGKPFANSSSLYLRWTLSECDEMAYWDSAEKYQRSEWENFLILRNISGQCIVRATVSGLAFTKENLSSLKGLRESLKEYNNYVLTDAVRLQLVSVLRIEPDVILLFYHPDTKAFVNVIGGTSDIEAAVNDTEIAEVVHGASDRQPMQMAVAARGFGNALLSVHDIGLQSPSSASALVRVADVDWIKLLLPEETSILHGSVREVGISVGTHDGYIFDASQIKFMSVHVYLEDDILELVEEDRSTKSSSKKIEGSTFFIRGSSIGFTTTLRVCAWQASGRQITSQFVKIEVYAPLLVNPSNLFLAPGAKYTLRINGGPQAGATIEFASMNSTVAKVDRVSGMMVAVSLGKTSIKVLAYDNVGDLICQGTCLIHVGIPSSMKLNLENMKLGVGRVFSIFPRSSEGDLFSFYEMCSNFEWRIENDKLLRFDSIEDSTAKMDEHLLLAKKDKAFPHSLDLSQVNFVTRVIGRSGGKTAVGVSFSCNFSSAGNQFLSVSYKAYDTVRVIPDLPLALGVPMTWLLPPSFTTSNVLPEWSNSFYGKDGRNHKGHVIYSILSGNDSEVNSISIDNGSIKTSNSNSMGCIEARDRATGRIEVAACVRVAEVSRILVGTQNFPYHIVELSGGTDHQLIIYYHDDLGNPFFQAHGSASVSVDINYPEVVSTTVTSIQEKGGSIAGALHLKALRQGKALLRLTLQNNPPIAVFILIQVGGFINPQNPILHVGSQHNFTITGKDSNGAEQGHWSSTNEDVLVIDSFSGETRAIREGTSEVIFKNSRITAYTSATVVKVASIDVLSAVDYVTNVNFPERGYIFPIKLSDFKGHAHEGLGEDVGDSYDCSVRPPYIGDCKPWRDSTTSSLYCALIPHTPEHLARTLLCFNEACQSMGDHDGILQISITANVKGRKEAHGSTEVIFKGGFSVPDMQELRMSSNKNVSRFVIVGSVGSIKFNWHNKDKLTINRVNYKPLGAGSVAEYEVKAVKQESFKDKIEITLPSTGQNVQIPIQYDAGKSAGSSMFLESTYTIIAICAALFMLSVMIYLRLLDQAELGRPNRGGMEREPTPDISYMEQTPPRTPARTCVASSDPRTPTPSPRLSTPPKPYTDYIKRSLDDSPLYNRSSHRSHDPSYSY